MKNFKETTINFMNKNLKKNIEKIKKVLKMKNIKKIENKITPEIDLGKIKEKKMKNLSLNQNIKEKDPQVLLKEKKIINIEIYIEYFIIIFNHFFLILYIYAYYI